MPVNEPHGRYFDLLLDRAQSVDYPSHRILERIESTITDRDMARDYLDVLFKQAKDQKYPSLQMLDRADHLITTMVLEDLIRERMRSDGR